MTRKLFNYPLPITTPAPDDAPEMPKNLNCVCPNPNAAFFCQTGHMTECHAGMDCREASCSHLPSYSDGEMTDYTVDAAPCWHIYVNHKKDFLYEIYVYAPSPELAEQCVRDWTLRSTELVKIKDELNYEATAADAEKLKKSATKTQLMQQLQFRGFSLEVLLQNQQVFDWIAEAMPAQPDEINTLSEAWVYMVWRSADAKTGVQLTLSPRPPVIRLLNLKGVRSTIRKFVNPFQDKVLDAFLWLKSVEDFTQSSTEEIQREGVENEPASRN